MKDQKCILFIAEDITLAQVVRLKVLADSLRNFRLNVYFACSKFPELVFEGTVFNKIKINNIGEDAAKKAVRNCERLYSLEILEKYVKEDLALIDQVKPDLIITDFRLSLCISAAYSKTPLATLINAYWSPYYKREAFPMPDHPLENLIGLPLMKVFYPIARPFAFRHFVKPFNQMRIRFGLKPLPGMQELLTYGDFTLYADPEPLYSLSQLPANHYFLGCIPWAPRINMSPQMEEIIKDDFIYITMGSSGRTDRIEEICKGLGQVPYKILLANTGKDIPNTAANIYQTGYLPGDRLAKACKLVVCNGGSTTGYQALMEGKPVIGIASNLDQYLCMEHIQKLGLGKLLRAGSLTARELQQTVEEVVHDRGYFQNAEKAKHIFKSQDLTKNFIRFLEKASMLNKVKVV